MRRVIASVIAAPLTIIFCTAPVNADGHADPNQSGPGIDYGVEIDPTGPTSDGTGDDGGTDGGTDNVTDGDSDGGGDGFLCVNENGHVWNGDSDSCGGFPQDGQGQGAEQPPPPVNPADLGGQVLDTMLIPSPQVSISPGPPNPTYVNLWTWFWVPESQWAARSQSISLRGTTVTVTIEPVRTTWETGESTVRCDGPGEAWSAGKGKRSSCGFEYSSPGAVTVSASIGWHASWTCSGVCIADGGDFGVIESDESSSQLEVRQRQSLVID